MKIFNIAPSYFFYGCLFTNTYTFKGATVKHIAKTSIKKLTFQRRQKPLSPGGFARDADTVVGGQMFQSFEHGFVGHGRHGQLRPYPTLATGEHLRTEQFMVLLWWKKTETGTSCASVYSSWMDVEQNTTPTKMKK
tara:strand:+ start:148 stop:555 length:408 start_codon:yes stop_codon:yes gene_type:complete